MECEIDSKESISELPRCFNDVNKTSENERIQNLLIERAAPQIKIGVDYQAFVPDLAVKSELNHDLPYENEDTLLWCPLYMGTEQLERYMIQSNGLAPESVGHIASDDEEALYTLLQCNYNVHEALRRQKLNFPHSSITGQVMSPWSENECQGFEYGYLKHHKDFSKIQTSFVTTRSLSEIVEFYYMWKKTARRDLLELKIRRDKKRCLDYMDYFVETDDDSRAGYKCQHFLKTPLSRRS